MRSLLFLLTLCICRISFAQHNGFWNALNESLIELSDDQVRGHIPNHYQTYSLELKGLINYLKDAPLERTLEGRNQPLSVHFPLPDGAMHEFMVVESPVMQPGIAARYDHIKSYSGYSVGEPKVNVRFLYSDLGFHAIFYSPNKRYYIQPYATHSDNNYIVYDRKDIEIPVSSVGVCGANHDFFQQGENMAQENGNGTLSATNRSAMEIVNIREYRMALAGVAEWTAVHGGTVSGGMSAANVVANTLNSFFTTDIAVRFVLIENNDLLIYTNPDTDPYYNITNTGPFDEENLRLTAQNQIVIDSIIGNENYDIGHLMTNACSGIGGQAALNSICQDGIKARGVTCQYSGNLEFIILEVAAHEIGHQFSADHTWNSCEGQIGSPPVDINTQRVEATAYEPGSGSTIMSYAGGCMSQNVQFNADPYFHVASLEQMYGSVEFGPGAQCVNLIPTNNHFPELSLNYQDGFHIPINTPFELTADATDMDGDDLSFCWEQYNLDDPLFMSNLGEPLFDGPSFRSWLPTSNPTRTFPRIQSIINNTSLDVEVLPTYTRNLKFRCTVRDNNPEVGGVVWDEISFEATEQAGPFRVQSPNMPGLTFERGQYIEVTWDVANTDAPPVNNSLVNIKLSVDRGFTFPYTLLSNTANDGVDSVYLPNVLTDDARIRVEAAENIFFDISNFDFTITEAAEPGFVFSPSPYAQLICAPDDIIIDLQTFGLLGYDSLVTFSVDGLPEGANALFGSNPAPASEGTTLTIQTADITEEGIFYTLEIAAIAPSADTLLSGDTTLVRFVTFDIGIDDFSSLIPMEPANGSSGVSEIPTYMWQPSLNAASYTIEIATNPSFAPETIVEIAQGIMGSSYTPTIQLEQNTLHFWRLRPQNECFVGEYTAPQGFYTEKFSCNNFVSEDVPVNISGVGTPTVESTLLIDTDITINDLNVSKIRGTHDLVRHLDVTLISPDETEVLLFSGKCGVSTAFDMALDDEAAAELGQCFNGTFLPEGMLSDFDGLQSLGTWTLRVSVNNPDGAGGALLEWALELCSNASANPPFLVTNEPMPVAPAQGRLITDEFLLSQDDDNGPSDLTYTLVTTPEFGTVLFQNEPLEVGMTFRQSSINAGNVKYVHNGGPEMMDGFTFAVEDGEGGWYGTPLFEIVIDPNVVVNTEDLRAENSFTVFPNPAQDRLNLQFQQAIDGRLDVRVTNIQGQVLQQQRFDNAAEQVQLNTSTLSDGIYFIYVETEMGAGTKKVLIQR